MSQSRRMSAVESVTNIACGFALAMVAQAYVFPMFGFIASTQEHFVIALIFTAVSLARSYALRRAFERWR